MESSATGSAPGGECQNVSAGGGPDARARPAKKKCAAKCKKAAGKKDGETRKTKAAASVRAKRKKPKDAGDWGSGENRAERMFDASVENCQCAGAAYYSTFLSVIAKYIGRFDARRGRAFAGDCRGFEHIGSIISDAFADAQRPTQPRE